MTKSTLFPKTIKDIKGKTAIAELQRTHLVVTLLSFTLIPLLIIGSIAPIHFDTTLSIIISILLGLVGLASLFTAIGLRKQK